MLGAPATNTLNNILLADWINRLTLSQIAVAAVGGVGMSAVAAAAGPAIVKWKGTA